MASAGSSTSIASILEFFNTIERLKTTKRTGWVNHKVPRPESISDHMHRVGIMAFIIDDPKLDRNKCIKMGIVHDLAESIVGDITPDEPVTKEEKYELERRGFVHLVDLLGNTAPAKEMFDLWEEYEQGKTPEALLVKDLDKFEALEYERRGREPGANEGRFLQPFFDSTKDVFTHPTVRAWVHELWRRRDEELPPS
ncbi:hypothetical protein DFJ74DRAFT_605032 [Hyaloraphidium curvatum]|nr:hypothetical protein DFJ74DRAFT_605032 [Hyaloraphidium curvatum]